MITSHCTATVIFEVTASLRSEKAHWQALLQVVDGLERVVALLTPTEVNLRRSRTRHGRCTSTDGLKLLHSEYIQSTVPTTRSYNPLFV